MFKIGSGGVYIRKGTTELTVNLTNDIQLSITTFLFMYVFHMGCLNLRLVDEHPQRAFWNYVFKSMDIEIEVDVVYSDFKKGF